MRPDNQPTRRETPRRAEKFSAPVLHLISYINARVSSHLQTFSDDGTAYLHTFYIIHHLKTREILPLYKCTSTPSTNLRHCFTPF